MKKTVLLYGFILALVLIGLKTIEYKWLVRDLGQHFYVFLIALFFMLLGIWFSYHLLTKRTTPQSDTNEAAIQALGLSNRELEILNKLAEGLTNQQIAEVSFVSINTVKTHLKNAFMKLEVNNRTEAVNKLRQLNIIR